MNTDVLTERLEAICREAAEREQAERRGSATTRWQESHPYVAADLAAATLHERMYRIVATFTKTSPEVQAWLSYPQPGLALIARGQRRVALRHQIGEWQFVVGCQLGESAPMQWVAVSPAVFRDVDLIAESMALFLVGKIDVMPTAP